MGHANLEHLMTLDAPALPFLNHRPWVLRGVMEEDCSALLKRFFLARRK